MPHLAYYSVFKVSLSLGRSGSCSSMWRQISNLGKQLVLHSIEAWFTLLVFLHTVTIFAFMGRDLY
jgi:hypothetical protein